MAKYSMLFEFEVDEGEWGKFDIDYSEIELRLFRQLYGCDPTDVKMDELQELDDRLAELEKAFLNRYPKMEVWSLTGRRSTSEPERQDIPRG